MRRRTKWLILSATCLVGMVVCLFLATPPQPTYQGRPLDAWLTDLASPDYKTQQLARVAIREMGPAAVPFLTNSLAQRNALTIRLKGKNLLPRRVLNWGRKVVKWQSPMMESRSAAIALQTLGRDATNAIPALIEATADPSWMIAQSAASALGSMGSAAAPAIRERLSTATGGQVTYLLQAVLALGTNAAPLSPNLALLLESSDSGLSGLAAITLTRMGSNAVPALVNLLSVTTNHAVQRRALITLMEIGQPAISATNVLIQLASSENADVRLHARQALASTLPPRDVSYPVWLSGLRDPDARNVEASLRYLTIFPTNIRAFNREIAALASHPTNSIRDIASNALTTFRAWPK